MSKKSPKVHTEESRASYSKKNSKSEAPSPQLPRYCRHAGTGQGSVYIGRRQIYLGPYGSPESLKRYSQIIAQWQAGDMTGGGRKLPADLTVVELVARFVAWARVRYSAKEMSAIAVGTRRLLRLYADTALDDFGPLALQAVRSAMIADDLCRSTVNAAVHRIRRIWRWAVRNQLIDETLWRALLSVPGLKAGEEGCRESIGVTPARWRQLRAVLRGAPRPVRDMVKLQILTGMRPGELVRLRPMDLELSPRGWLYRPEKHKTTHLGKGRVVIIGPRAQELLAGRLAGADPDVAVFSPAEAVEEDRARRLAIGAAAGRLAAHEPAHRRALRRARGVHPRRIGAGYSVTAYRKALRVACDRAFPLPAHLARLADESADQWKERLGADLWAEVSRWRQEHGLRPHQLRHSFATRIGNRFGHEAAQKLLGHARIDTTDIYVERDLRAGRKIIAEVG